MDYREISKLFIKLTGLLIIAYSVVYLPYEIRSVLDPRPESVSIVQYIGVKIVPYLLPVILGGLLWFFPGTLTNTFVKGESQANGKGETLEKLEIVAVSVLGLYLLFKAISDLTYHISLISITGGLRPSTPVDQVALVISTILEFILAAILLLKAKGIVYLLTRLRDAGTDK